MRKIALLAATALSFADASHADLAEVCPVMPAGVGLEWKYEQGPDFDLCYAVSITDKADSFGIYLGRYPSFEPDPALRITNGEVGGFAVTWYKPDAESGSTPHGRQAVFAVHSQSSLAHVWLQAQTQDELDQKLAILKALKFK